jgi:16S rRNA (adenine1518-N6/adenine1519-N6)-dimethyltransferase
VAAGEVKAGDRVLEIGPGLGPLTERLLEAGAEVLAVELDRRLMEVLRERFAGRLIPDARVQTAEHAECTEGGRLELVQADALQWLKRGGHSWAGWKVVSNLPYSVGSPVLVELALADAPPELVVATLQREVVDRLRAAEGEDAYGVLSLLVRLRFEVTGWFKVPSGCFFPEPGVESACVTLRRRKVELLEGGLRKDSVRLVKMAFSQRRKMMIKLLRAGWDGALLERVFGELGLDLKVRAERVSLEQFVEMTRRLCG